MKNFNKNAEKEFLRISKIIIAIIIIIGGGVWAGIRVSHFSSLFWGILAGVGTSMAISIVYMFFYNAYLHPENLPNYYDPYDPS
ncbi:MAG: hypothetical protein AAB514_00755 [Patescibacteria group bacterium]